ncbi:hypothetical protein T484DRAFT_1859242, partial [Baffinella frigidus]
MVNGGSVRAGAESVGSFVPVQSEGPGVDMRCAPDHHRGRARRGAWLALALVLALAELRGASACGDWEEVFPASDKNHMECATKSNTWMTMPGTGASNTAGDCREWCCAQTDTDINRIEFNTGGGDCECGTCTENVEGNGNTKKKLFYIPMICQAGSNVGADGDSCATCEAGTYTAAAGESTSVCGSFAVHARTAVTFS